jgi:DNA-binding transcriptional regulator YhcF (GntR family)
VPAFQINITTGSGTPIYRQIVDRVRLAVATGDVPAGQAMPSVRNVADRLVVKAYGELVRDGVLESRQGLGFFDNDELSLIVVNPGGQTHRLLESLGAVAVDEQPVGLEEALIAYVGRHGRKSHLLKHFGGLK